MFSILVRSSSKPCRKRRSYPHFHTDPKPQKQSTLAKRIKYYIPSAGWIPNYSLSLYVLRLKDLIIQTYAPSTDRLSGDILAGLTVASMLIPQSVSYASSLAKLSPAAGLVRINSVPPQTIRKLKAQ